ncbi:hypothetical protein RB594_002324 [Gaeumannomyces avenae]
MEALGAAASVIGVISLAIQLCGGARQLVEFLGTIDDAPGEVIRLRDLISLVHSIAAGVRNMLEHQRQLLGDSTFGLETIHDALRACQQRIENIRSAIEKTGVILGQESSLVKRNWCRFKLAIKKDAIESLERQLGHALQALNLSLTINAMWLSTKNTMFISAQIPEAPSVDENRQIQEITDTETTIGQTKAGSATPVPLQPRRSSRWATLTTKMWFGDIPWAARVKVEEKTRKRVFSDGDREDIYASTETVTRYIIFPNFLRWSVEILSRRSAGTPSFGLNFQHFLPREYLDSLSLFENDDLEQLQKLLATGQLHIDTQDEYGRSLIQHASYNGEAFRIFSFLLSQTIISDTKLLFDFSQIRALELRQGRSSNNVTYEESVNQIFSLLWGRSNFGHDLFDNIPRRFCIFNDSSSELVVFLHTVSHVLESSYDEPKLVTAQYFGALLSWICLHWHMLDDQESSRSIRDGTARRLIQRGANLHEISWDDGGSPLEALLKFYANDSSLYTWNNDGSMITEATTFFLDEWLGLLEDCQVDVEKYLRTEIARTGNAFELLYPISNCYTSFRPSRLQPLRPHSRALRFQYGLAPTTDPYGGAKEVLEEFNFNNNLMIPFCDIRRTDCKEVISFLRDLNDKRDPVIVDAEPGASLKDLLWRWAKRPGQLQSPPLSGTQQTQSPCTSEGVSREEEAGLEEFDGGVVVCSADLDGNLLDLWPFCGRVHTMCGTGMWPTYGKFSQECQKNFMLWRSVHSTCLLTMRDSTGSRRRRRRSGSERWALSPHRHKCQGLGWSEGEGRKRGEDRKREILTTKHSNGSVFPFCIYSWFWILWSFCYKPLRRTRARAPCHASAFFKPVTRVPAFWRPRSARPHPQTPR